jgi:surface polysaccharide O-acyltransferase-like enzyme
VLSLQLLPAMLVGYLLSPLLARHTDRGWMRPAMLALCVGAAALLIVKGVSSFVGEPRAADVGLQEGG